MNRLEEAYRSLGEDAPTLGDADRAIGTARRRRAAAVAGVPFVVALLVAGALVVGNLWPGRREVAQPPPAFTIDTWAWPTSSTNNGARVGTLIYQYCVGGNHCPVYLRRADGKEVALRALRPDLAEILESHAGTLAENRSLSYDAQWLGVGVGSGYDIYRLDDPSRVLRLPKGPAGSYWRVIDWGQSSREVVLALYEGNWVKRYAWVSLAGDGSIGTYEPDRRTEYELPERMEGDGVVVAGPVTKDHPVVTELSTSVLKLTGPDKGKIEPWWSGTVLPDVAAFLRPGETLAGEGGVAESSCPPTDGTSICPTVVWSGGRVTGVVKAWTGSDGVRFDVPDGFYIGLLPIDAIAVRKPGQPEELVAVFADGKQQRIATLKKDETILLPGMTGGS